MNLRPLSYRLIFPLLAVVSLVTFWRINKVSFFHHFIRVIAEVEERNSHELSSDDKLAVLTLEAIQGTTVASSGTIPAPGYTTLGCDSHSLFADLQPSFVDTGIHLIQPIRGP